MPLQSDSEGEFTARYWYLWKDSISVDIAVATKGALPMARSATRAHAGAHDVPARPLFLC